MTIKVGGNKGGGGSLSVRNDNIFANSTDRNDFFNNNSSRLIEGTTITVAGKLQKYINSSWVEITPVITGPSGQNAPSLLLQYSATGNSGWSNTLNTALHKYWRWSTDNGATWSANFVKFSGDGNSGVPEPYSLSVGADQKLRLSKNSTVIQEQDETGSTILGHTVFHAGNAQLQATALNGLTGTQRILGSAIRDYPVMSSTVAGVAKLGTTLTVDASGVLNAAVSPTSIKIVANQAARLAIPTSTGATLAIQQDNGFTYGIEANQDASVNSNWKQIGTVATNVVSFNGRNGAVVPVNTDYTLDLIKATDTVTSKKYVIEIRNGVVGLLETA